MLKTLERWWPWAPKSEKEYLLAVNAAQKAENDRLYAANQRLQEEKNKVADDNWHLRDLGTRDALRAAKAEKALEYFLGIVAAEVGKAERTKAYFDSVMVRANEMTGVEITEESPC